MSKINRVGVNDATYSVYSKVNGSVVRCKAYVAWRAMLNRAYGKSYKERFNTYCGVSVCDEWHYFMTFRKWWIDNKVDGWQLDKDLVGDGKTYSPSTCVYIPCWLNSFTTSRSALRGSYPVGVSIDKQTGKFHSRCHHPKTLKSEFLGAFLSSDDAYMAWLKRKLEIAMELKDEMDAIDERIYEGVVKIIKETK